MLKTRIIPMLLHNGRTLVKGKQFKSWRIVGSAVQAARIYQQRGVDELVMLNVGGNPPDFELIEELSRDCFMPLAVGGGFQNLEQVHQAFEHGADKVIFNSVVFTNRPVIEQVAKRYGAQAVTVCIDVDARGDVRYDGGRSVSHARPEHLAGSLVHSGVGEFIIQSIPHDGMMVGYNIELVCEVASSVSVPVIASCGAGTPEHCAQALRAGAHAVAAGAMFQFLETTPRDVAEYLHEQGFAVRIAA